MNFVREMEETEEILQEMSQNLRSDQYRERELIELLFSQLKERQMLSSAALGVKDAYRRLKEEVRVSLLVQ